MALLKSIRQHWFSVTLYVLLSVFFLVASVLSASTYVSVVSALDKIDLGEASYSASELDNGTLVISFSIDLENPSRYDIDMYTINWEVTLPNGTSGPGWLISVTSVYMGPGQASVVPSGETVTFDYVSFVSDPGTLSKLDGFVNYSNGLGEDYTLETLPYVHEFDAIGWLGDFSHDYLREFYLNDMVKVSLSYNSRWSQ